MNNSAIVVISKGTQTHYGFVVFESYPIKVYLAFKSVGYFKARVRGYRLVRWSAVSHSSVFNAISEPS